VLDPARRARSLLVTASHIEVGVLGSRTLLGSHVVDGHGGLVFPGSAVPGGCLDRLVAGEPAPLIDVVAWDVATVAQPDRLRGVLRLSGRPQLSTDRLPDDALVHLRIRPSDPVIRLAPVDISLEWHIECDGASRTVAVPQPLYVGARPDGLVEWEGPWATHLAAHHDDSCRSLARRVADVGDDVMVRPILADEGGIVIRAYEANGVRDLRVPFPRRVSCPCEATAALGLLISQ
jgi:hypothetical protein